MEGHEGYVGRVMLYKYFCLQFGDMFTKENYIFSPGRCEVSDRLRIVVNILISIILAPLFVGFVTFEFLKQL